MWSIIRKNLRIQIIPENLRVAFIFLNRRDPAAAGLTYRTENDAREGYEASLRRYA
jgi:hypothetical protein